MVSDVSIGCLDVTREVLHRLLCIVDVVCGDAGVVDVEFGVFSIVGSNITSLEGVIALGNGGEVDVGITLRVLVLIAASLLRLMVVVSIFKVSVLMVASLRVNALF